ncbi:MAG: hypothetical protein K2I29_00390 [Clostridia bacterium]|nr:hypothetical protein [Clostridia bacterium]
MDNQNNKSCDNCYYFYQHYYKSKYGKLTCVWGDGHCTNNNLTVNVSRKIIFKQHICEFWEPAEALIAERQENINAIILKMKQRLDELVAILQE